MVEMVRAQGMLYTSDVQSVLLYGSDSWVVKVTCSYFYRDSIISYQGVIWG